MVEKHVSTRTWRDRGDDPSGNDNRGARPAGLRTGGDSSERKAEGLTRVAADLPRKAAAGG